MNKKREVDLAKEATVGEQPSIAVILEEKVVVDTFANTGQLFINTCVSTGEGISFPESDLEKAITMALKHCGLRSGCAHVNNRNSLRISSVPYSAITSFP